MATPSSRETLKQYALRALGKPVIDINVDDDQLEDRLDEAFQYYAQYHYDGVRRTYLKYEYTQADYNRITVDGSNETATKNSVSSTFKEGQNYIVVPESVFSVINIDGMTDGSGITLADADKFAVSDAGTEKFITASNIKGYIAGSTINFTGTVQIGGAEVSTKPFAIAQAVALG